ncbi:MAG: hypothetical protein ABH864_04805 [archaeon]
MSIFKKRGSEDVLDLTDMQRRGLLQKSAEIERQFVQRKDSAGYFDFTGVTSGAGTGVTACSNNPSSGTGSQFDFLDALASTSGASSSGSASSGSSGVDSLEIQGLKNKIDDLEYKLQILEDKTAKLSG